MRTVFGKRTRIMSVLSYAKTPDEKGSPEKNVTLYGRRVERIYRDRGIPLHRGEGGEVMVPKNQQTPQQTQQQTPSKL